MLWKKKVTRSDFLGLLLLLLLLRLALLIKTKLNISNNYFNKRMQLIERISQFMCTNYNITFCIDIDTSSMVAALNNRLTFFLSTHYVWLVQKCVQLVCFDAARGILSFQLFNCFSGNSKCEVCKSVLQILSNYKQSIKRDKENSF